jgi:hypothetical protein
MTVRQYGRVVNVGKPCYAVKVWDCSDNRFWTGRWVSLGTVRGALRQTRLKHARALLTKHKWHWWNNDWKLVKKRRGK